MKTHLIFLRNLHVNWSKMSHHPKAPLPVSACRCHLTSKLTVEEISLLDQLVLHPSVSCLDSDEPISLGTVNQTVYRMPMKRSHMKMPPSGSLLPSVFSNSKLLIWSSNFNKISAISPSSSPSSGTINGNFKERDIPITCIWLGLIFWCVRVLIRDLYTAQKVTKSRFCNRLTLDSFLKLLSYPLFVFRL